MTFLPPPPPPQQKRGEGWYITKCEPRAYFLKYAVYAYAYICPWMNLHIHGTLCMSNILTWLCLYAQIFNLTLSICQIFYIGLIFLPIIIIRSHFYQDIFSQYKCKSFHKFCTWTHICILYLLYFPDNPLLTHTWNQTNRVSDWLAAVLATNQRPTLNILVNWHGFQHECFLVRRAHGT